MSISTILTKHSYAGNNSIVTQYPITFKYLDESHISVYFDGVLQTKGAGADYVVGGDGTSSVPASRTGHITTNVAQPPTVTVTIVLDVPLDQPVSLLETGLLPAKTIEVEGFDRLNMQIRRVWRKLGDVLTFSNDEGGTGSTGTADNLIGFDGSGDIAEIPNTTFLQQDNNLSELANAPDQAAAQTNLNVDPAGTDNSTDVTKTGAGTYISLAGQVLTVDAITESDISDLGAYIENVTGSPLSELQDATITNPVSGETLEWNGSAWVNSLSNTQVDTSDTAPVSPNDGDLWYDSTSGLMYVYYYDGSSSQWVTITSAVSSLDASSVAYTPAGTGAVVTDLQTKNRESVSVTDYSTTAQAITYAVANNKQAIFRTDTTINVPTDCTLQQAFTNTITDDSDTKITVNIETSELVTQLSLSNGQYGNYTITSVDATCPVDSSIDGDVFLFDGVTAPLIDICLDCAIAPNADVGYHYINASTGRFSATNTAGCINAQSDGGGGWGILVENASRVAASNTKWNGNEYRAVHITTGSVCEFSGSAVNNNTGVDAIWVSRGSVAILDGIQCTGNTSNGLSIKRSRASLVPFSTENLDISNNGGTNISVSDNSSLFAGSRSGRVVDASGAGSAGVLVEKASTAELEGIILSNATGTGLLVNKCSSANARDAVIISCGDRAVLVTNGSSADIELADCTLAAGTNAVECRRGSQLGAISADARKTVGVDGSNDFVVSNGGIISANAGTGGTNITPDTIDPQGIIFK